MTGQIDLVMGEAPARRAWKALTLKNPWGWAMVTAPEAIRKRVENRDWPPPPPIRAGEWFLLHAGAGWDDQEALDFIEETVGGPLPEIAAQQAGHLLAFARVLTVVEGRPVPGERGTWRGLPPGQERWFFGPYGWVLEVKALEKLHPCRGWHKFWSVEKQLAKDLDAVGVVEVLDELDAEAQRLGLVT